MLKHAFRVLLACGVMSLAQAGLGQSGAAGPGGQEKPPASRQPQAASATTGPATAPAAVDAAKLVEEVRQSEQWVHEAKSLYIRFKTTWINSSQQIASRTAELKKDWPDEEVDANRFPELRPTTEEVVELAFDQTRVAERVTGSLGISFSRWDGKEGLRLWQKLPDGRVEVAIDNSACGGDMLSLTSRMSWPMACPLWWWWQSTEAKRVEAELLPKPAEFALTGTKRFRGGQCYVLERRRPPAVVWYVGVEDHRLRGIQDFSQPVAMSAQERANVIGRIAGLVGGDFKTDEEMDKWRSSAPPDKQELLDKASADCFWPYQRLRVEHWLTDYRQAAPGCWVPMRQGYICLTHPTRDKAVEGNAMEVEVTEVRANEPLSDEVFRIDVPEGATVSDWREKPRILYRYKKNRTADEWLQTRKEAIQQNDLAAAGYRLQGLLTCKPPRFPSLTGYVQARDFAPARNAAGLPNKAIISEAGERYKDKQPFKIALSSSKDDLARPDRVFIDFTGTGKFAPGAAIDVRRSTAGKTFDFTGRFGPAEINVQRNGREYVVCLVGEVLRIDKQYLVGVALLPMLEGSCSFGAKAHRVRLLDVASFNRNWSGRLKHRPNSTLMLIDADDRGFASPLPANIGQQVMVDGEWYEVSAVDGKVQARAVEVKAALLSMPGIRWDAELVRDGNSFFVAGGKKAVAVPAGKYELGGVRVWTEDDPDAGAVAIGYGGPKLNLQPGQELALGNPFPLQGKLQARVGSDRAASFLLGVRTKSGLALIGLKFKGGLADQPAPPRVIVKDESGEVVNRGTMEYG